MLKYALKHKGEANFVIKLYKKFVKIPKLDDSEWPEHAHTRQEISTANKSLNDRMKDLVFNYL